MPFRLQVLTKSVSDFFNNLHAKVHSFDLSSETEIGYAHKVILRCTENKDTLLRLLKGFTEDNIFWLKQDMSSENGTCEGLLEGQLARIAASNAEMRTIRQTKHVRHRQATVHWQQQAIKMLAQSNRVKKHLKNAQHSRKQELSLQVQEKEDAIAFMARWSAGEGKGHLDAYLFDDAGEKEDGPSDDEEETDMAGDHAIMVYSRAMWRVATNRFMALVGLTE